MNKTELLNRLSDIEWDDFEVKEARTELPKNIWETVSAFANSSGVRGL
jgi:ATP-dependent DNA helicase RecG